MPTLIDSYGAGAFGEDTIALFMAFDKACAARLDCKEEDVQATLNSWIFTDRVLPKVFLKEFLDGQLASGCSPRAMLTFLMVFTRDVHFEPLRGYISSFFIKVLSLEAAYIFHSGGFLPLIPLFDAAHRVIPGLASQLYRIIHQLTRNNRFPGREYRQASLEMFSDTYGQNVNVRGHQYYIHQISGNRDPKDRIDANTGGDPKLYEFFLSVFNGAQIPGVSLEQAVRYMVLDIANGPVNDQHCFGECLNVLFYPMGLLSHLRGEPYEVLVPKLAIVMRSIMRALNMPSHEVGALTRGALINLFYFDPQALKHLKPLLREMAGQGPANNFAQLKDHPVTLGGPLALICDQSRNDRQSLLPFHLECLAKAGFSLGFDDVAGGAVAPEAQAWMLKQAGGCTPGLRRLLSGQPTALPVPFCELEESVDYASLIDSEAAFLIAEACALTAKRYEYWSIHQRGITSMRPELCKAGVQRMNTATRIMVIDRLASTDRLGQDAITLLGVSGNELKATGRDFSDQQWEGALQEDLGL